MSELVIQAENISKHYQLGVLGSGTLKRDMHNWWLKSVLKKELLQENEANSKQHIWALRDINFEIKKGDSVGFIGKNGSGKSTLLKIISRIILPTSGTIKGNGKVASLLEVGTGFHPELTGRENIILNGQILGMNKKEVIRKFDEIVAFSGVERFIDTPVKRYSSGMYVRLAFAVAAHLNSDILIVDEVLAVGDADFQKKCLGKMKEVSEEKGKTILFVSHNLQAVRNLCNKAIYLDQGQMVDFGKPDSIISSYLIKEKVETLEQHYESWYNAPGNDYIRIKLVKLIPQFINEINTIDIRTPLLFHFECWVINSRLLRENVFAIIELFSLTGECIFKVMSDATLIEQGLLSGSIHIPGNFLNNGYYYISISFMDNKGEKIFEFPASVAVEVADYRENTPFFDKWNGAVRPHFPIDLNFKKHILN